MTGEFLSPGLSQENAGLTWAGGRAYGTQRGNLFFAESATGQVVDKGSFFLMGKRYLPIQIISDIQGNLLGISGGRLFQYLPESDEVRISDVDLDGWLLPGPQGKLYALFQDGRLFRWEPDKDDLVLVARYAPFPLDQSSKDPRYRFRGIFCSHRHRRIGASAQRNRRRPENGVMIYTPDGSPPVNLGNPVPGSFYLTAPDRSERQALFMV